VSNPSRIEVPPTGFLFAPGLGAPVLTASVTATLVVQGLKRTTGGTTPEPGQTA
jgi:hypothetical protein